MPIYTYRREDGSTFDVRQKFSEPALETCPTTGQKVSRVIHAAGVIFKGSGFYVTDNKSSKNPAAPTNGHNNGTASESSSSEPTSTDKSSAPAENKSKSENSPAKTDSPSTSSSAAK